MYQLYIYSKTNTCVSLKLYIDQKIAGSILIIAAKYEEYIILSRI